MLSPLFRKVWKQFNEFWENNRASISSSNLKRQKIRLALIAIGIFFILQITLSWFITDAPSPSKRVSLESDNPRENIAPSDLERTVQQAHIDLLASKNTENKLLIETMKNTVEKQEEMLQLFLRAQMDLEDQIQNVRQESDQKILKTQKQQNALFDTLSQGISPADKAKSSLKIISPDRKLKTTKNYIPSGSFFDATMIGGVDVSTSLLSQTNLRPVLFYVTNIAQLPNMSDSDIQYCHVLCGAYGDLSAERAYMRTEQLSCVRKNGKIIDIPIQGYVTDESGKDGVRGSVVLRENDLLTKSFFAASFGAIGNLAEAAGAREGSSENMDWQQSMQSTLIQGAGTAVKRSANRLEDYLIKRLEAISPTIQVQAGRKLNIVITQGFFTDEILE